MPTSVELGPVYRFIFNQLVPIAIIVFIISILIRIRAWRRGLPEFKPPFKPSLWDLIAMRRPLLRKGVGFRWMVMWLMHFSLLLVFVGHLRPLGVWSLKWFTWLMPEKVLKDTLPIAVGIVFAVTVFLILAQKLISTGLTIPPTRLFDYLAIIFLFFHVWSGIISRLLPRTAGYLVITIFPGIPMTLEVIPQLDVLAFHVLVSSLFIICIPFTEFLHIITGPTK